MGGKSSPAHFLPQACSGLEAEAFGRAWHWETSVLVDVLLTSGVATMTVLASLSDMPDLSVQHWFRAMIMLNLYSF